ncbi:MAG: InlB B-repeat-containing protein [Clostridiales bacterium]|nr:InlB B-repeat-containing protein [Clostridiales bacterium]
MKKNRVLQLFAIASLLLALVVCVAALPVKARVYAEEDPVVDEAAAEDAMADDGEGEKEFEAYNLTIAGTNVNSDNAGDLTELNFVSGDEATYDPDTNTLTLKNVTISSEEPVYDCAIAYDGEDPLTIKVVGKTTLEAPEVGIAIGARYSFVVEEGPESAYANEPQGFADVEADSAGLIIDIAADSLLVIDVNSDSTCSGILSHEDVIICGDGAFDISVTSTKGYATAIGDGSQMTIGVTIKNTGASKITSEGDSEDGIYVDEVIIDGAELTIKVTSSDSCSYAIYTHICTINDSTVTVTANGSSGFAVFADEGVEIISSTVTVTSKATSSSDRALLSNGFISITENSTVTVTSSAEENSLAILAGESSFAMTEVAGFEDYEGPYIEITDSTVTATATAENGRASAIESAGIIGVSGSTLTASATSNTATATSNTASATSKNCVAFGILAEDFLSITDDSKVEATSVAAGHSFAIILGYPEIEGAVREDEVQGFADVDEAVPNAILISDSKVTATAKSGEERAALAIMAMGDIQIISSKVEAKANVDKDAKSYEGGAIVVYGSLSIEGKTTVVDAQANLMGVFAGTITVDEVLGIEKPENGVIISAENCVFVGVSSEDGEEDAATEVLIKAPTVKVTIDPNNGEDPYEEEVIVGDPIPEPEDPKKEDHEFVGWYDDPDLTQPHDFDEPVEEGKTYTLYAKWKEVAKQEEKPAEEKPSEEKLAEGKPAEQNPAQENPTQEAEPGKQEENKELNVQYIVVSGGNGVFDQGSGLAPKVIVKRSEFDEKTFDLFRFLKLRRANSQQVTTLQKGVDFSVVRGSVVIEIKPETLDALEPGEYVLTFEFEDGQVETKITIKPKQASATPGIPKTGEVNRANTWLVLFAVSAVSVIAIPVLEKKRRTQN